MSLEKYQPTPEDINRAEEMMTEEQKAMSVKREKEIAVQKQEKPVESQASPEGAAEIETTITGEQPEATVTQPRDLYENDEESISPDIGSTLDTKRREIRRQIDERERLLKRTGWLPMTNEEQRALREEEQERQKRLEELFAKLKRQQEQSDLTPEQKLYQLAEAAGQVGGDKEFNFFDRLGVDELATLVKINESKQSEAVERAHRQWEAKHENMTRWKKFWDTAPTERDDEWTRQHAEPKWSAVARNRLVDKIMQLNKEEKEQRLDNNPSEFETHAIHRLLGHY